LDALFAAFRFLITALLRESWPPLATLAPISLLSGIGMLWVYGRVSNQEAIRRTRKRLNAALYELRLFADEPGLVFRAQKDLLAGNIRYLALMLLPAVILTIPMVLLLAQLDAAYGRKPLTPGQAAMVTVQLSGPMDASAPRPVLEAPDGVSVETGAIRQLVEGRLSWRIRPTRPVAGTLRIVFPELTLEKSIEARPGLRYLSARRVRPLLDQLLYAGENRLPPGRADWIEVGYPSAEVKFMGIGLHWLIWFLVLSLASAWLLRKRFRVTI